MNTPTPRFRSILIVWLGQFIHKLLQRPDSHPIKYYRKTRRVKFHNHNS